MTEFKLPAIGEGVVEVEIVRWLKQPGERVETNDAIVEVMTDKATVEIPSPYAGWVAEILAAEGVTTAVGETICTLNLSDPAHGSAVPSGGSARVLATPAARALAREAGIDLHHVVPHDGRITKRDVEDARRHRSGASTPGPRTVQAPLPPPRPQTAAAAPPAPHHDPPSPPAPSAPTAASPTPAPSAPALSSPASARASTAPARDRVPFRGMRRRTAEMMSKAFRSAVHYTYVDEVDVSQLVAVREQAKKAALADGIVLTYLPFVIKAVIRGLKKFPFVNAQLDETQEEIILHRHYDIGIATATEHGLFVPVLRDADRKSLLDIAAEIQQLVDTARLGQASREQLGGSTFTITSLGAIGGLHATPILNYPEVGILGIHAIRKVPVVDRDDRIVIGHVMNLSVSFDHRIVDGFDGASFLQEVKRYLEDPTLLLLAGI